MAIPPLRGLDMSRLICLFVEADHNSQSRRHPNDPVVGLTGARFGGAAGRRSRAAVEPPEEGDAVAPGARGPSILRLWRHQQEAQNSEQQAAEAIAAQLPPGPRQAVPQPEIAPPPALKPHQAGGADWDTSKETYDLVRPYSWTRGRTTSCVDLAVETLVSATGRPLDPLAGPEHRTILRLCATPHSVAELAALLSMPLGVARVLLGDLAAAGSIAVHRTVGSADAATDVALMQRVLVGLQRL
jgi:Protein of unknown function (DUF742)